MNSDAKYALSKKNQYSDKLLCMRNRRGHPSFDSFVRILILLDGAYFASLFTHALPTAAHFLVTSLWYSGLSFGARTKTRASSV